MHVHKAAFNHVTILYTVKVRPVAPGSSLREVDIVDFVYESFLVLTTVILSFCLCGFSPVWTAPSCFLSLETPVIGYFSFKRRCSMYGVSCVESFEDSKC